MAIALNPETERRLQDEVVKGHYPGPSELIDHALELVAAERDLERRQQIAARIEESVQQADRGETYSMEEAQKILAERRAARMAG
jgi:Arc/MetJ-type ribon-helix-helix transcriptional regulator